MCIRDSFWFDKGVDGFRVDMASSLIKNDPDKKEVSKLWNEMRAWKDKYLSLIHI